MIRFACLCASLALLPSCATARPARPAAAEVESPASRLGEAAEELYDDAWASTWDKAEAHRRAVHAAMDDLGPRPDSAVAAKLRGLIAELDGALARKDRIASLKASNELTRAALDLAPVETGAPPHEIGLLDVEGRALSIAAEEGDLARARVVATDIKRVWEAAKTSVVAHGGARESSRFEGTIASLDGASSAAAFAGIAKSLLDQVDLLERVYDRRLFSMPFELASSGAGDPCWASVRDPRSGGRDTGHGARGTGHAVPLRDPRSAIPAPRIPHPARSPSTSTRHEHRLPPCPRTIRSPTTQRPEWGDPVRPRLSNPRPQTWVKVRPIRAPSGIRRTSPNLGARYV